MNRRNTEFLPTVTTVQRLERQPALTGHTALLQDIDDYGLLFSGANAELVLMRKKFFALTTLLLAGGFIAPAGAQSFETKYQEAFARRVGNSGSTSALSDFVRVAVEAGQYDQALSTIEEHLINYPLDPKAHLIAARLYQNVGSRELAARHVEIALDIGTLDAGDERSARRLQASIERSFAGFSGFLDLTTGVRSETIDFAPTAPWTDRTDVNPFFVASAQLRYDLETSTNNAILLFGEFTARRRFGDFNFDGFGPGVYYAPQGRAGITLDVGLPTELIPTLRGQLTAYGDYEAFDLGIYRAVYGGTVRLTAAPTANTFVYAEGGLAWLGASDALLFEDDRYSFEVGASWRLFNSHTIGIAGRGYVDRLRTFGEIAHLYEAEFSYAGQVMAFDSGAVWTQSAGVAVADIQVPNVVLGPLFPNFGGYWRTYWSHSLQIDDISRFDLDLSYRETDYTVPTNRSQSKFDVSLSYTISLF